MIRLIFTILMFFSYSSFAVIQDDFIKKAMDTKLYENPQWKALLHYKTVNFIQEKSVISSDNFFLSPNGVYDEKDEMEATIKAFFQPNREEKPYTKNAKNHYLISGINQHALCKYPARYDFLNAYLNLNLKKPDCKSYKKWAENFDGDSVSLIFASSYIYNPVSAFGHTFLKFNNKKQKERVINFAAEISGRISVGGFVFNGFTGGYPGIYNFVPYAEKKTKYLVDENRNLVEYNLNLSSKETDFLLKHMWEVSDTYSDYYFLNGNCSSNIIELINVSRVGVDLSDKHKMIVLPVDTIAVLDKNGLLDDNNIKLIPSLQNKIKNMYSQLDEKTKKVSLQQVKVLNFEDDTYLSLSNVQKAKILEVLNSVQQYNFDRDKIDSVAHKSNTFKIYQEKNKIKETYLFKDDTKVSRIERGHNVHSVGLELGYSDLTKEYMSLNGRLFLHDLLDDDFGYMKYSAVKIAEYKINYLTDNQKLYLDKFTFINVASFNKKEAFFNPIAWELDFSYGKFEDVKRWNINKDTWNFNFALGKNFNFYDQSYFLLLDNGIKWSLNQELFEQDLLAFTGIKTGFFVFYDKIKSITEFKYNIFTDKDYNFYGITQKLRYNINYNNGLTLNFSYKYYYDLKLENKEMSVNYTRFF